MFGNKEARVEFMWWVEQLKVALSENDVELCGLHKEIECLNTKFANTQDSSNF